MTHPTTPPASLPVSSAGGSRQSHRALDTLNFMLADVRDGIGPFLAIWLLASHQWDPAAIGLVMGVMPLASVLMLGPAGAWIDATRHKRLLLALACALVALCCAVMPFWPVPAFIIGAQITLGLATAILAPGVLALSLGIAGAKRLDRRIGRNEVFNHAGNVVSALLAGLIGHFVAREAIFYLVAMFAVLSIAAALAVREQDIDHAVARGARAEHALPEPGTRPAPGKASMRQLLTPALLGFAGAIFLFHAANAAMMPLVGQALAHGTAKGASLYMSACIIVAQLVMIPMAALAGRKAPIWGRRPLLLFAFAVLPVRGLLYTAGDHPAWLIAVQTLDGVAGGLLGVVTALVVADLTRGSGRTNFAHGLLAAATGVGAFLSNTLTGQLVAATSYNHGFAALAAVSALALLVCWRFVPESGLPARST